MVFDKKSCIDFLFITQVLFNFDNDGEEYFGSVRDGHI